MTSIEIAGRKVGPGHPCFVIAEAGVNHNGSLDLALRLVEVAAEAGADAVKFQTFKTSKVMAASAPKAAYQRTTTGDDESQWELIRRLELPLEDFATIQQACADRGILFLSTPFDEESLDFLLRLDVPAVKIPSGEITNLPFLRRLGGSGKPLIVSTGMCRLGEVETALATLQAAGARHVALLHCVSNYPAEAADANLRAMKTMAEAFDLPIGYSDHTLGTEIAFAAVALGACVIEKHLTLDPSLPGPDHRSSLPAAEFGDLVRGIRRVEQALGHGRKLPAASEADTANVARRSLVAARPIAAGESLTEELIAIKRPGTGLPPAALGWVLGRRVRRAIAADAILELSMLE